MNNYVVAWFSFDTNEITQTSMFADSPSHAVLKYIRLYKNGDEWADSLLKAKPRFSSEEDFFDYIDEQVFNCDNVVNVMKL